MCQNIFSNLYKIRFCSSYYIGESNDIVNDDDYDNDGYNEMCDVVIYIIEHMQLF